MIKRHYDTALLILLTCVVGLWLANNGNPNVLHPDEVFILKRPFKRLLEYSQFDFSSTFSLYDLLLVLWYGLFFLIGVALDFWGGLSEFKQAIVVEDFKIIYWGRTLSVVFVLVANIFLHRHLRSRHNNQQIWVAIIIALNLFLIPSAFWIKYDALMYLAFTIIFVLLFNYVVAKKRGYRNVLYLSFFIALSIRVEVSLLFVFFGVFDFYSHYQSHAIRSFWSRTWVMYVIIGVLFFCVVTVYPLVLLNNFFGGPESGLLASKTYESVIVSDLLRNLLNGTVLLVTLMYYIKVVVLLGGPVIIYSFLFLRRTDKIERAFFFSYVAAYAGVVTLSGFSAVHYVIGFVPLLTLLGFEEVLSKKSPSVILILSAIYVLSAVIPFFFVKLNREDARHLARQFLLQRTSSSDTLAIETISMNGYHPLIDEYPSDLCKKASLAQQISPTAGVGYLEKAKQMKDTTNCRHILDIFSSNYLSEDSGQSNRFINVYDSVDFASRGVRFLVLSNWRKEGLSLTKPEDKVAEFRPFEFFDPRCNLLSAYQPTFGIYQVNHRSGK